ncbi:TPA: hypothetical protein ACH3X3_011125 [Trebouxia sp. C0006]
MPFQGTRGAKRSAVSEDLVPATAPATKLHKDASGDVRTPRTPRTQPRLRLLYQRMQLRRHQLHSPWSSSHRIATFEQLPAQLAEVQSQLKAAVISFNKKLEEQTQSSVAREDAVRDSRQQRISALDSTLEMLNQRIRARNMVVHALPDTAAVSKPAALERLVKDRVDSIGPNRGSSQVSQSITTVTRIGRLGVGNRAMLGISLIDELTPKQQHAQEALDPDRIALRSTGFRTWFRHGTLWYLDQGVPREFKQGEAVRLLQAQGSLPRPNIPAARAPPRGPSGRPRQTPGRSRAASQQAPLKLTGWWRLFQQAARRLFALPTQMQALLAPHTPLWSSHSCGHRSCCSC